MAKKRQKIANRETKYELLRQSEHRDEQNHIANQPTQQLYRENYYEKDADDNYSLNSATQRSIQSSHERSQRKTNMQQRQATYNTGSASTVSRNLVDDVGKRYGYSRPTPKKQTLTSDDIRNDALNELKNRSTPSNATPSTATPSTATRTGNTQTTVSKSLVDYVEENGNNRTAQATRHHAAMTDFANKGINKAIVDAIKAPINALRNAGGNPLKMADAEAEKMRKLERNPAAIPEQIRQYSEMTPGQKYMYNHLYDSQGRDAVEEHRSKIMDDINRRVAKQNVEGNIANKVAAGRVANQFIGGVTNSGEGLQKIAQWATLDNKKRAKSVNDYETEMRREKAGKIEGVLQDVASAAGNMTGSVALGNAIGTAGGLSSAAAAKLSSAAFGASQGGHAYQQAINEGHSTLRSAAFAGEEAASEFLTEQILGGVKALGGSSWTRYSKLPGTDVVASKVADASTALLNPETEKMAMGQIKKAIVDGMRNKKVKEYLFNALREGSQEGLQYWTTGIARNIILDEGRDEDGKLNPVKGLSFSDPNFWYSAAVGALNSVVMNAGSDLTSNAIKNSNAYKDYRYEQQFKDGKYVNVNDNMYSEVDPYTGNEGYTEFTEAPVQGENMQPPATYGTTFSDTETPGNIFKDNNITVTTDGSGSDTKDATNAAVDKLKKTRRKPAKTADDTKNVADATHDAVNEAVDALKERSEQNTADSTPDAAKEATQAAVEAINTEDAAPVAQETEDSQDLIQEPTAEESQNLIEEPAGDSESQSSADIIDQAFNRGGIINQDAINHASPEDLQKIVDIFEGKNEDSDESAPVQEHSEQLQEPEPKTNEPVGNSDRKLTTNQLHDKLKSNGKFTADQIEYEITADEDGYVGRLRDTKNDKFGGMIVDGRALRYVTKPYESRDAVIDDLTAFAENNGLTRNEKAAAEADSFVSGGILQPDVADALTDRAYKRFGTKEAERRTYIDFFSLGSEQWPSVDTSTVYKWDNFMSQVYQAGLNGEPYSRLSNDSNFAEFYKMPVGPDAADAMWKLGYNQYNIRKQKNEEKKEEPKEAPKEASKPAPAAKTSPAAPEKKPVANSNPQSSIADRVAEKVASGQSFTANWLFDVANNAYGGTMADGTYSVKDAYDGMELGINKYLMNADFVKAGNGSLEDALNTLSELQGIMRNIPTQTKRTEEMESYQQFSTPPTIAFTAARLANITSDDVVLESSAGIGGLALLGKAFGAKVYGNELSKRRLAFLNELGLDGTFNENAEQINNVLPDDVQPTVVIMNPPFSSTAGRMKTNKTANAKRHIEQALDRLQEGGRLVAILGRGMADDAPSFSAWWNDLRREYTIRSNVRIDGSNYQKYGTTFDDQLVVIDKVGPQEGKTLTGEYKELSELLTDLEGVRNERNPISRSDMESDKSFSESGAGRPGVVPERTERSGSGTHDGSGDDAADRRGISGSREEGLGESGGRGVRRNGSERDSRNPGKSEDGRVGTGRSTERRVSESSSKGNESDSGRADQSVKLEKPASSEKAERVANVDINSTFTPYVPEKVRINGAKAHPGKLVESAAMGAVEPPDATYVPHLPQELIDRGMPSSAQLENIVYAGQAHQQFLPSGERKGYFIGDGTGVGKGLQLASIILDNFNQGRKKAVWVSEKESLIEDAQRDWADLEQDKKDVFSFKKFKNKDIAASEGICFATYDTLGSRKQDGIDRLTNWLGEDFDGVIVLDEAHNMKNAVRIKKARGSSEPTQKAIWGLKLQEAFPKARIVYATATGASSIENFAYLERLGLWGPGTSFANFNDFYTKVSAGGLAAMELVARDMKSLGDYMARSISYDGVQYDTIEHELTPIQHEIYDKMSDAWRVVLRNIDKALELTGASNNGNARGAAASAFWGSLQRFYNQILTSMAMPSVLSDIQTQLDNGKSVVIQLTNTNEAEAKRKIADNAKNGGDLDDLDLTPSETLIDFLQKSFPVQSYEEYQDENGNTHSKPVTNSNGEPVLDKKAIALRDKLIEEVGQMQVPDGPLEMLLDTFGVDNVAEVTGRTRRVVYHRQPDGSMKRVVEKWSKDKGEADTAAFQAGKKRILIFSEAGGTGKSYHADLRAKNQQQRVHYILQAGWKADAAIQGLGRTHRTNEASAPIYKLVTTNVMGQKRFTSTIAKRLNQMGALTKGQRDAGSGVFSERDNLENPISEDALAKYYESAPDEVIRELGIKIYDKNGLINKSSTDLRNVPKFLNRILALRVEDQNEVFENFYSILEEMTENAMKDGTLDRGMESYKADKIEVADEKPVYQDENTHAETKYVQLKVYNRPTLIPYENVEDAHLNFMGMYRLKDGSVRAVYKGSTTTDKRTGEVVQKYRLDGPVRGKSSYFVEKTFNEQAEKLPKKEWKKAWEAETQKAPEYVENTLHMLTGTLLPIWSKLPENNTRVMRIVTTDGKQYLGRVISPDQIDSVLRNLGTARTKKQYTLKSLMSEVLDKNQELVLRDNRWKIRRRKVSGEWRIEVTGSNLWALNRVEGIISETIGYEKRYFVPTGSKGEYTLGSIIRSNPVMDVRSAGTEDDDGVLHSLSATDRNHTSLRNSLPGEESTQHTHTNGDGLHVGKVTVIGKPFTGKTPVETKTARERVLVPKPALDKAASVMNDARSDKNTKSFKGFVKSEYQKIFGEKRRMPVQGVRFNNQPYVVDLNGSLVAKVINDKNISPEKLAVIGTLNEVVKNATFVGSGTYIKDGKNRNQNVSRYDYFETDVEIDGKPYVVAFDVEVFRDSNNYRTHKVINEMNLTGSGLPGPAPGALDPSGSTDSITQSENSEQLNAKVSSDSSDKQHQQNWTAEKNKDSTETSSKRLSDIIGQAAHDWGFNVTSGTRYVKGEGNMGEFNERNRGIRTKITNDLPTFSHEFGHWLDKTYNITGSARLPKEVRKDIETAFFMNPDNADLYSGKSASVKLKEGLAEFVRYYLQNRDAARIDFPKLTDYILKQMSPGELAKFNGFADQVNAYYSMDAGDAKSSIRLKEDSRPDYRTNMEKFHDWYHGWYQENVDSVHGFREFDVRNGTNTYTYATNAAYTDARVAQTIIEGIYDLDGNYIGPGLKDALSGIDVNDKEVYIAFGEYLALKHGIEWIAQGKRVFADDRKNNAQWMENRISEIEAEHPEFIEAADRLYKFESDFMWTYAVGEGLISADAYKAMQKENPCYVPFFRAGFKERGNSLFKAKGSGRDLIHPVDNIIDNITKLQNAAARNAVMLQLRREAVRSKADALFMEKMPDPKVPVEVDLRGIKDRLYNETHDIAGIEIAPEMQDALQEVIGSIDDTMTQFQLGKAKPNRGEIKILVAGKPEFWKINDPLLLSSITSMDYRNASKVITAFGSVSRFITSNITGNNVIWSVFSNAPRDLQTLLTYSMATKNPGKMLQGVADTYLNYINNARGKSVDPLFSEYLAMGGEGAPVWSGSKDYVKDMRKLLSSTREHPEMNPLKWAMFVSDMIEMGPRFATYKMCREAGMNPQKAFYAAMDITVNFRRNGINSKTLNQFIPFFNAGVQATDKMIRYFTAEDLREMKFVGGAGDGGDGTGKWVEVNGKERGRAIAGRVAFSVALSLIMAALVVAWSRRNKESKDDFDMLSNYTKNSYFCISLGDGKYFTIPKGQNVAVLESFFERLLERTVGDNDHAFDEYYSYLTESTLPSIASNFAEYPVNVLANGGQEATLDLISGTLGSLGAVGEMAQLFANKDYLGRPIVSKQNKDKDYRLQYSEKSSEMAYLLGKYGGWSPQMVDHFGKNILGWMWSYPSAIFPINDGKGVKGKRDWTMGVKNTYLRDNVYSNDLGNWIYDKSGESSKMYKSYGTNEQALESTLDSNMKSYYQNTIGLAKGQEDEREIRRAALDKLKAYRKESDHGVEDADRKAIYDIVESNGNSSILPGVMDTSIKSDGKTYDLSGKEYMQYQDAYESYYYDLADDCINPGDSEDKQSQISGELKQLAREQAMDEILSKKGIESGKPSKLKDWTDSGYDAEDYFSLKDKMNAAKVGKDGTDARKKAVGSVINSSGLSADAKKKLWEIAGYKSK
nr:MAG TPA: hypothetical protein [Caudoviricetes sp.]